MSQNFAIEASVVHLYMGSKPNQRLIFGLDKMVFLEINDALVI